MPDPTVNPSPPVPGAVPEADPDADLLVTFLWHHHAHCPRCGYDMHRATVPVCPECGLRLAFRVTTAVPLIRPWLLFTVPLLMSAGVGVALAALTSKDGFPPADQGVGFWLCYLYFLACVPLAIGAVAGRKWFASLHTEQQRLAAAISIASAVAAYGLFIAEVR
jgi:hypothetical protein